MTLLVSLVFTAAPAPRAYAASYVVNTLNDNTTDDAFCTLREAINAANNTGGSNTNCGALSNADDTITFSVSGTITLGATLPNIVSGQGTLTIDGTGQTVTISGNNLVRVMDVAVGASLTLNNLTIANGNSGSGGGIYNSGTLTLTNSIISGNNATFEGGGIYTTNSTLHVINSTISGNTAYKAGGIFSWLSTVTVTNSTISGNTSIEAPQAGGIFSYGWLTVTNSTISGNVGGRGGGIGNYGVLTVTNSTISGNSATTGGGIASIWNGGGIPMTVTVTNSTISGNSAGTGGGMYQDGSYTITLSNTIVANSTSGGNCTGTITDGGNNLDSANTCGFTTNAKINTNPNLGPLTGSPQYFPLNTGSAAIDAGSNTVCAAAPVNNTSQNGVTRPTDGDGNGTATCDIGSYEVPTFVPSSAPVVPSASFNGNTTATDGGAFYLNAFYGHVHLNDYGNHYRGAVVITSNGTTVCIQVPAGYEAIGATCFTDKDGGRKDFYIKPKAQPVSQPVIINGVAVGASGGTFNLSPWQLIIPANVLPNGSTLKLDFFFGAIPNTPNGLRLFARVMNAQIFNSAGTEIKSFTPPLQICFTYTDAELQSVGGDAKNFVVLTSSDGKTWEELVTTVDTANKKVCASVTHFSLFELAARTPTKIPTTGDMSTPLWIYGIVLLLGAGVGWLVIRRRKTT